MQCCEEVDFECGLGSSVAANHTAGGRYFTTSLPEAGRVFRPYGQLYFISTQVHPAKEADLEHWEVYCKRSRYISSWQNVLLFALLSSARSEFYARIWQTGRRTLMLPRVHGQDPAGLGVLFQHHPRG